MTKTLSKQVKIKDLNGFREFLRESNIPGTITKNTVHKANLSNTNIDIGVMDINFAGCQFNDATLSNARPGVANFTRCTFKRAGLNGMNFSFSQIGNCYFLDLNLFEANIARSDLSGTTFKNVDLERANMFDTNLSTTTFKNCNIGGMDISGSRLLDEEKKSAVTFPHSVMARIPSITNIHQRVLDIAAKAQGEATDKKHPGDLWVDAILSLVAIDQTLSERLGSELLATLILHKSDPKMVYAPDFYEDIESVWENMHLLAQKGA